MNERLLQFFKLFNDANRLRIAGLLIDNPCSVEEIASRLNIKAVDVPRQIGQFEKMGLLISENDCYRLNVRALEQLSREVLADHRPTSEAHSNDADTDDFDRKVVKNFSLPNGRIRELPNQEKKLLAILRHVVQVFEPGTRYTEKQVNEILARFYPDTASLRRYLIDRQLIQREPNGATYWR